MSPHILRSLTGLAFLVGAGVFAQPCLVSYTFTSSPNPVAGTYGCGETVTFCYTVTNWNSTNVNWFHGLEITFGPGWDMTTLVPGPPPATCGASGGAWGWYNSVTGTATTASGPQGPGFFFDLDNDGNPGNNFGDFCVGAVNWQFCWTISVLSPPDCVNGLGLGVSVNSFGDSETGSWSSSGCVGDNIATNPGPPVIAACAVTAGMGAPLDLCSSSPPADLFLVLGGAPDVGGAWTAAGGGPHSGTFDPAIDGAGNYTYTVTSVAPPCQSQAVVAVTLQQQPDAGSDGSITTCASDIPFSLLTLLGGVPAPGGTWTAPGGAASTGTFDPAADGAGIYVYEIAGVAPCVSAQSSVTVTVNPAPNAGSDGAISICSNEAPYALFTSLGGSPSAGGTWTAPGGLPMSGIYAPASDAPGIFAYEVNGVAPCPNSIATVTVTENVLPNAGIDATVSFCETNAAIPFITLLGGSPDAGGSWTGPDGLPVGATLDPATASNGDHTYTVLGNAPCPDALAIVTLTITTQPSAGTDANLNLCEGSLPTDLFTVLGGSPDAGGSWTDPLGAPIGAIFDPIFSAPGTYSYTIAATSPCVDASATVNVNVAAQSSAGVDAALDVCSDSPAIALLPLLGPTAQPGGAWTDPNGAPAGATFTPGTSIDGGYTYTIIGTAPCVTVSATVTLFTIPAANPGADGSLTLCVTGPVEDLFTALNGAPMAGGDWTSPMGAPFSGILDPATGIPGIYTYTLAANGPCPAASATVDVTIEADPDAGQDGAVSLCGNAGPYAMITGLNGTPAANGTWTGPGGQAHGASFVPGTDAPGDYTYTVYAPPPCISASSTLTVGEVQPVSAGTGGSVSLCENATPLDASTWLGGMPTAGGTWTDPSGAPVVLVDPSAALAGDYTYTVQGTTPCPDAAAVVALTIDALPNAGTDAVLSLCDAAPPAVLINWLGGAQPGGTWNGPSGAATGVFAPGVNVPGAYVYTVVGSGACSAEQDQASIDVYLDPLPAPTFSLSVASGCVPLQVEFAIDDPLGLQGATWTFGDGSIGDALVDAWHTYTTAGTFTVELQVTDANGCIGTGIQTNAILVSAGPEAIFGATPLRVSVLDPVMHVVHAPEETVDYAWSIDGLSITGAENFSWTFDPPEVGLHSICLDATDTLGCVNSYCLQILVDDVLTVFVPNAFTPDGDGHNDTFLPSVIGVDPEYYFFHIFDRWGSVVFSSTDPTEAWNGAMDNSGEVLQQDVYVWRMIARDQFSAAKKELFGTATLVK